MTILSLDTAGEWGSWGIWRDGKPFMQNELHSPDGFSHILFKELEGHLADVDVFAAASGPGSFTGVRVALATVKGLAEALGKGALGVSNLQALATFGTEPLRAVLIDARRSECYAAIYDDQLRLRSAEVVGNPVSWLQSLPDDSYQFVSQDVAWVRPLLEQTSFAHAQAVEAPRYLAAAVAECVALQIEQGASTDSIALDANYVRRSDVNLYWHDR